MALKVEWRGTDKKPRIAPNPDYPEGIDIDMSDGAAKTCSVQLAYPAPCIGHYRIRCLICGKTAVVTAAGRPDDPRKFTMACKAQ